MNELEDRLKGIFNGRDSLPLYKFQYEQPTNLQEAAFLCANWHLHMTQLLVDIREQENPHSRWVAERLPHLLGLCKDSNFCLWCAGEQVNV